MTNHQKCSTSNEVCHHHQQQNESQQLHTPPHTTTPSPTEWETLRLSMNNPNAMIALASEVGTIIIRSNDSWIGISHDDILRIFCRQ